MKNSYIEDYYEAKHTNHIAKEEKDSNAYSSFNYRMKKIKDTIDDIKGDLDYLKTDRENIKNNYQIKELSGIQNKQPKHVSSQRNDPKEKSSRNRNADKIYRSNRSNQKSMNHYREASNEKKYQLDLEKYASNKSNEDNSEAESENKYRNLIKENVKNNIKPTKEDLTKQTTQDTDHLEKLISRLHVTINELQKNNNYLQKELSKKNKEQDVEQDKLNEKKQIPYQRYDLVGQRSNKLERPLSQKHYKSQSNKYNNEKLENKRFKEYSSNNVEATHYNNDIYHKPQSYNDSLIADLQNLLGAVRPEEILPICKDIVKEANCRKQESELINKIKDLYTATRNNNKNLQKESDDSFFKSIWSWVKLLVKNQKSNVDKKDGIYKELCESLMNEYQLNDVKELGEFVRELVEKNQNNKTRVKQIRKLLMTEPTNYKFSENE